MNIKQTERITKAIAYFKGLKPSEFSLGGVVNPTRYRELVAFFDLISESLNDGEQKKLDLVQPLDSLSTEEQMEVLNG